MRGALWYPRVFCMSVSWKWRSAAQAVGATNGASTYLHELERIGILKSEKIGTEILYLNTRLYDLLSH